MDRGQKRYVRSRFPTFELNYQQGFGISAIGENFSEFSRLELSMKQQMRLSLFDRLNYKLIAGKFFNNNPFNYVDYKHFNAGGTLLFTADDWKNSYVLLPFYTYSSNREWIQAFINYNTDYLLLKRLPFLQGKLFTETLQAKFLHTPDKKYYSEWGYSIDLPMGLGSAGVFVSFDAFRYNSLGVQFSIPLINSKGNNSVEITIGN
jgi:hypothetical protein